MPSPRDLLTRSKSFVRRAARAVKHRVVSGRADRAGAGIVRDPDRVVSLRSARWRGGGRFEITGWAFRRGASSVPDARIWLTNDKTGAVAEGAVRHRPDREVNAAAKDRDHDHAAAGFVAVFDFSALPSTRGTGRTSRWTTHVSFSHGDGQDAGPFATRSIQGSAAALMAADVAPGLSVHPAWTEHAGLRFVCEPGPAGDHAGSASEPSLVVERLGFVGGERPALEIAGAAHGVREVATLLLRGSRQVVTATSVEVAEGRFSASFALTATQWGADGLALVSGTYEVSAAGENGENGENGEDGEGAVPVVLARLVVDHLPERHLHELFALRLERGKAGSVRAVIGAPRALEEVGDYHQNVLRERYRQDDPDPEDAVYLESWNGKSAADSVLAIDRELVRRGSTLKRYWGVADRSVAVPDGATPVIIKSRQWWDVIGRVRYFVTNAWVSGELVKRPHQQVVQTWHGTPLKLMGIDRPANKAKAGYADRTARETAVWDYLLSANPHSTEVFRRAYMYDGNLLELGYPRNDALPPGRSDRGPSVRRLLGIGDGQKVVLFMPTWRENQKKMVRHLDLDELATSLGDGYTFLVRGHANTLRHDRAVSGRQIIDVTTYPEISDLYLASDIAITDYSSAMFDFTVTGKPILFFVPDMDDYRDRLRGVYFDLAEVAPGPLLARTGEVAPVIANIDKVHHDHAERYAAWQQRFNALDDGEAAVRVVDAIFERR